MKFLIIAVRFHTNLYYRTKALQDAGHSVKVVVLYKGISEFYEKLDVQEMKLSFFSSILLSPFLLFKKNKLKSRIELRLLFPGQHLNKIIKSYNPDVILLKAYQNLLSIKTLVVAKKHRIKVLMLTQTTLTNIKGSQCLFRINIKLFKYLNVFAYITPIKKNFDAFKSFGIKNVHYLPFVYPAKNKYQKKTDHVVMILSVGKYQKRKDQLLLLKSFNTLVKKDYNAKLCLIGELADKKYFTLLNNFIEKNSLNDKVCLKTNFSYKEIRKEYQKYDIFVLPAYDEPAAYSPVEALANGLPVICSNENGTNCYIENNKNGFVFEAKNQSNLTEKLILCISDKNLLIKMKNYAIDTATRNHNPDVYVNRLLKILQKKKSV